MNYDWNTNSKIEFGHDLTMSRQEFMAFLLEEARHRPLMLGLIIEEYSDD